MRNNNCAQLDIPSQRNREEGDMVKNQEIQKSDISMIDVTDARCIPIPTSTNLNYGTQSAVKIPMKNASSPIDPDVRPGFSSLRTPRFSGLPRSQHPSNSHETTCRSPRPPGTRSRGYVAATSIGDYATTFLEPHEVPPNYHKLQKSYADIDSSPGFLEPNSRDSNNVKSSLVKVPLKNILNPNDPGLPPGFSDLEPPGFPQLPHHPCPSSSPHTRCPMPLLLDCRRQEHSTISVGFPPRSSIQQEVQQKCHQEVGGSTYPDIPPGFPKLGPPGLPEFLSSPNHPISSSETSCKVPRFSRMDWSDDVPSTTVGGYGPADSELNHVQPNLPQASDYWHKPEEHHRSHHPTNLAKDVKSFNSFDSSNSDTKLHSTSKKLPSSASKDNTCRSSGSHERLATSNKRSASSSSSQARRGCDFIERDTCRYDTLKRDTKVHSASTNHGYIAAKEKGKSEMKVTRFDKSSIMEEKGKQENGSHGRIIELQECSKIPHERNTKSTTGGAEVQGMKKLDLSNKKLSLASKLCDTPSGSLEPTLSAARGETVLLQVTKRSVSSDLMHKDENKCIKKTPSLSKVVSGNLPTSFVSAFYDSTPNSPLSPLSSPHTGTQSVQESKTSFSEGYTSNEDLGGTQKMKCQRLLEPKNKDLSLVSGAQIGRDEGHESNRKLSGGWIQEEHMDRQFEVDSVNDNSPGSHASHSSLLLLFPEEAQSIRARVAEHSDGKNDLELSVGRSVPWITPDISLSRLQHVKDGNVWISKSTRDRLKREGCGNELRL